MILLRMVKEIKKIIILALTVDHQQTKPSYTVEKKKQETNNNNNKIPVEELERRLRG